METHKEDHPFLLTEHTSFFIYGASIERGCYIKDKLLKLGCQVMGFIDRQGNQLPPIDDFPIRTLEDTLDSWEHPEKSVVVITVANRFLHSEIAQQLWDSGFSYVLFEPAQVVTEEEKHLSFLYNQLASVMEEGSQFLHQKMPSCFSLNQRQERKLYLRKEEKGSVVTFVPTEIVHTKTASMIESEGIPVKKALGKIVGKNFSHKNIMLYFYEGVQKSILDLEDSLTLRDFFKDCLSEIRRDTITEAHFEKVFKERYDVLQKMEFKFATDPLFFQNNPCDLAWCEDGIFHLMDGNNRNCFLVSKGIYLLPARMSEEDFSKWVHQPVLDKVISFLKEHSIKTFDYPIAHPYFLQKESREEIFSHQKALCVGRWLEGYDLSKWKVLDVQSQTGFYSHLLTKMGAEVTSLECDPILFQLQLLLNQLLYVEGIHLRQESVEEISSGEVYDLTFVPRSMLSFDDLSLLAQLDSVTTGMMIIDLEAKTGTADKILKNSNFSNYITLKTLHLYHKIYDITLFLK